VVVNVDEAGRDDLLFGVDRFRSRCPWQMADRHDAVTAYADVARIEPVGDQRIHEHSRVMRAGHFPERRECALQHQGPGPLGGQIDGHGASQRLAKQDDFRFLDLLAIRQLSSRCAGIEQQARNCRRPFAPSIPPIVEHQQRHVVPLAPSLRERRSVRQVPRIAVQHKHRRSRLRRAKIPAVQPKAVCRAEPAVLERLIGGPPVPLRKRRRKECQELVGSAERRLQRLVAQQLPLLDELLASSFELPVGVGKLLAGGVELQRRLVEWLVQPNVPLQCFAIRPIRLCLFWIATTQRPDECYTGRHGAGGQHDSICGFGHHSAHM
jgi:hypothetical protein